MLWSNAYGCSVSLHIRSVYVGYPTGSVLGFTCGHCIYRLYRSEAVPGVLGNRRTRAIFSGEQRPKNKGNRGTQAIFGNREHSKSRFCFWGTRPFFRGEQGNRYPPPGRASRVGTAVLSPYGPLGIPYSL